MPAGAERIEALRRAGQLRYLADRKRDREQTRPTRNSGRER
jgi:hypothetical protein